MPDDCAQRRDEPIAWAPGSGETVLSLERTDLSADRTLMSAVRTALALIGFGFTIYELLTGFAATGVLPEAGDAPRRLGLALVGLGLLSLALAVSSHRRSRRALVLRIKALKARGLLPAAFEPHGTPVFAIAATVLLGGAFALAMMAAQLSGAK